MAKDAMASSKMADYLFSAMMLKRTERSGWRTIGIKQPESVADHTYGTCIVGMMLARMEGADEEKVLKMCLLHDLHEARIGDLNLLNKQYVKRDGRAAFKDAVAGAVDASEMERMFAEFCAGKTLEARVARDADALDMLIEAKLIVDTGNRYAKDWIRSAKGKITTRSGKMLAAELEKRDSVEWLLKKFR